MKPRNELIQNVIELHQRVGYEHPNAAKLGSDSRRAFWMHAIDEEIDELREAISRNDIIAVADAIGDSVYVLLGASLAFGLPFERIFEAIHSSNMTKDVILVNSSDEGGMEKKLVKGDSYYPPDIESAITKRF